MGSLKLFHQESHTRLVFDETLIGFVENDKIEEFLKFEDIEKTYDMLIVGIRDILPAVYIIDFSEHLKELPDWVIQVFEKKLWYIIFDTSNVLVANYLESIRVFYKQELKNRNIQPLKKSL